MVGESIGFTAGAGAACAGALAGLGAGAEAALLFASLVGLFVVGLVAVGLVVDGFDAAFVVAFVSALVVALVVAFVFALAAVRAGVLLLALLAANFASVFGDAAFDALASLAVLLGAAFFVTGNFAAAFAPLAELVEAALFLADAALFTGLAIALEGVLVTDALVADAFAGAFLEAVAGREGELLRALEAAMRKVLRFVLSCGYYLCDV